MTDHDSDRLVVLSVKKKLAWKSWYEIAVHSWSIGEKSVGRKADLDDIRQLSCLIRDVARFSQCRDVQQSEVVLENVLLLICRDDWLPAGTLRNSLCKRYWSLVTAIGLIVSAI